MNNKEIEDKWNLIFIDFLDQMNGLFPESPASDLKTKFKISSYIGGRKPILLFIDTIGEHQEQIMNQDDEYFFSGKNNIKFISDLELDYYYKLSSSNNKKIIWSFMKTLFQMAKIYKNTI